MDCYKVIKVKKGDFYQVVNISQKAKKSCLVKGNLPKLYPNMYINLEIDFLDDEHSIIDFKLNVSETNQKVLSENDIDIAEYVRKLNRYVEIRKYMPDCKWDITDHSIKEFYTILPFNEADELHKNMIDSMTDKERIRGINKNIIKLARSKRKISYTIPEYMDMFSDIEKQGSYAATSKSIKILAITDTCFVYKNGLLWDEELLRKSEIVLHRISNMNKNASELISQSEIDEYSKTLKGLDDDQRNALNCGRDTSPCIITGGAGVGKTTVIDSILKCHASVKGKDSVLLVAPTGKAARRLSEKTGLPASTIHRAIRKSPSDEYVGYNPSSPLPHNLVVVDESSMIDTEIMYDLLGAISENSKIIFVGDHNQLYPVGYGEPFFDFMKMLPVYKLTTNHRQNEKTDLLKIANDILKDKPIKSGRGVEVYDINESDITSYVNDDKEVQYISPFNKVNDRINNMLKKGNKAFNVSDKVIFGRNTENYCNGDIGVITAILKDEIIVKVDKRSISVPKADFKDLSLAYSITVHKMQGSENDKVVLFVPKNNSFVDKRMLYTAVTRTKENLKVYRYEEGK